MNENKGKLEDESVCRIHLNLLHLHGGTNDSWNNENTEKQLTVSQINTSMGIFFRNGPRIERDFDIDLILPPVHFKSGMPNGARSRFISSRRELGGIFLKNIHVSASLEVTLREPNYLQVHEERC